MKKILVLPILLLSFISVFSQKGKYERIKALKTAYITDKVGLTAAEAERFWPIYNQYDNELHALKKVKKHKLMRQIRMPGNVDQLTELEAEKMLNDLRELNASIYTKEQEKAQALQKVLSSKKLLKLYRSEITFKRELLQRLRDKKRM